MKPLLYPNSSFKNISLFYYYAFLKLCLKIIFWHLFIYFSLFSLSSVYFFFSQSPMFHVSKGFFFFFKQKPIIIYIFSDNGDLTLLWTRLKNEKCIGLPSLEHSSLSELFIASCRLPNESCETNEQLVSLVILTPEISLPQTDKQTNRQNNILTENLITYCAIKP